MEHRAPRRSAKPTPTTHRNFWSHIVSAPKNTAESPGRQSGERGTRAVGANSAVIRGKRNKGALARQLTPQATGIRHRVP